MALPHVFSVVAINPVFRPPPSRRTTRDRAPPVDVFPPRCGPLVRSLWVTSTRLSERSIRSVFDVVRGAHDLALSWDRFRDVCRSHYLHNQPVLDESAECGKPHPSALHYPRPHLGSPCLRLTVLSPWISFVWREDAFATRVGCSLFLGLTHLRLIEFEPRRLPLARLVNLTHLAVPPPRDFAGAGSLVGSPEVMASEGAPRLKMVVVTFDAESPTRSLAELRSLAMVEDPRIHVVVAPCRAPAIRAEWERAARGGESLWERALRERREWLGAASDIPERPGTDKATSHLHPESPETDGKRDERGLA